MDGYYVLDKRLCKNMTVVLLLSAVKNVQSYKYKEIVINSEVYFEANCEAVCKEGTPASVDQIVIWSSRLILVSHSRAKRLCLPGSCSG